MASHLLIRFGDHCPCGTEYSIVGLYLSEALDFYVEFKCRACGHEAEWAMFKDQIEGWCRKASEIDAKRNLTIN